MGLKWLKNIFIIHRLILLLKHFLMGNYRCVEVNMWKYSCIWKTWMVKSLKVFLEINPSTCMVPKENNKEGNSNFLFNFNFRWFEFPHVSCVFYLHLHVYLKAHLCYDILYIKATVVVSVCYRVVCSAQPCHNFYGRTGY